MYYFPSYLKYVAALPWGILKFKLVVKLQNKITTRIIFVKNDSFIQNLPTNTDAISS